MNLSELQPIKTIRPRAGVSIRKPKEPGIEFARFAMALGMAKGNLPQAVEIAKTRWGTESQIVTALKGAVAAGSTTSDTWAAPLVDSYQRFTGDFIEYLRPQTILGKFGTGKIPSLRRVPFNIAVPKQISGGAAAWVQEGRAKPLTAFDFSTVTLGHAKVAAISVLTDELIRFSNPSAELIVRDALAGAVIERLDFDFVDPSKAAEENVSPASITNGVAGIPSVGNDADSIRADVRAVFAAYLAANVTPIAGVWIMPALTAFSLSLLRTPLGEPEFEGIDLEGGKFMGLPVIVSDYVPDGMVVLCNARDIYLADDGVVNIDVSNEASLEFSDTPVGSSTTPTGTNLISLFQTNSTAFRAERWINWQKRRANAAVFLSGVNWGAEAVTT